MKAIRLVLLPLSFTILVLGLSPGTAGAWGDEGHHIVVLIAQTRVTPYTLATMQGLLGQTSLTDAATFADHPYRPAHHESKQWHFVDIPRGTAHYDATRDCAATPDGDCVIQELESQSSRREPSHDDGHTPRLTTAPASAGAVTA